MRQVNRFVSSLGVSLVVSGGIVRKSLSTFGMRGHTSLSNMCNCLQVLPHSLPISSSASAYGGFRRHSQ